MNQEEYHKFVFERLGKDFPDLQVYVEWKPREQRTMYKVSLDSDQDNHLKDPKCSSVDFSCRRKDDRLEHIWLRLKEDRRGEGLGRKLVRFLEEAALAFNRPKLQVNINVNESFWEHMGFKRVGDAWIKDVV